MKKPKAKKNKKRIKELEEQNQQLTEKWKRALADYQNLEKKTEAQKKDWIEFANKELLLKLLSVLENLEKAVLSLKDEGLKLILNEFKKILQTEGLNDINIQKGSEFDTTIMECIDVKKGKKGKVLGVLEKGYMFKDKVLRVARVVVGKNKIANDK